MTLFERIPHLKSCEGELSILDGYCIAYFQHEVLVGLWQGEPVFYHKPEWNKILELHIFNENVEYRVIKTEKNFLVHIRTDADQENVFDEAMCIIGNTQKVQTDQRFVLIGESGRRITIPTSLQGKSIVVRNYLSYERMDDLGMPGCEVMHMNDWRFVGFVDEKEVSTKW